MTGVAAQKETELRGKCQCGHPFSMHHKLKDCLETLDNKRGKYCTYKAFRRPLHPRNGKA